MITIVIFAIAIQKPNQIELPRRYSFLERYKPSVVKFDAAAWNGVKGIRLPGQLQAVKAYFSFSAKTIKTSIIAYQQAHKGWRHSVSTNDFDVWRKETNPTGQLSLYHDPNFWGRVSGKFRCVLLAMYYDRLSG